MPIVKCFLGSLKGGGLESLVTTVCVMLARMPTIVHTQNNISGTCQGLLTILWVIYSYPESIFIFSCDYFEQDKLKVTSTRVPSQV